MKTQRTDAEKAYIEHLENLRRSNAARPIPSKKAYKRKPKHRREW